jgi:methylmalonyl-CoA carboxyltransferase large subunit
MQALDTETLTLIAELREELNTLKQRVEHLELQASQAARAAQAAPSEEDMLAISAAVAAFLGLHVRIRQVHLVHSSAWAQVGRMGVQASHRFN